MQWKTIIIACEILRFSKKIFWEPDTETNFAVKTIKQLNKNYKYLRTNFDLHGHEVLYRMKIEFLILTY